MFFEKLTIVFAFETFSPELALNGIKSVLSEHNASLEGFNLSGKSLNLSDALLRLKRAKRKTLTISSDNFEFDLGCVRNFQLDFLTVKWSHAQRISPDAWATPFIGNPNFVMAQLADVEYDLWQNAEDPLQYTANGKSHDHLPKKSNGLPYPLDQMIIDTSSNPGRWFLCQGYIEAVGSIMWLGESFWQKTRANRNEVLSADWLDASFPTESVIRIQAAHKSFSSDTDGSGELQKKLRLLLFPQTSKSKR